MQERPRRYIACEHASEQLLNSFTGNAMKAACTVAALHFFFLNNYFIYIYNLFPGGGGGRRGDLVAASWFS